MTLLMSGYDVIYTIPGRMNVKEDNQLAFVISDELRITKVIRKFIKKVSGEEKPID